MTAEDHPPSLEELHREARRFHQTFASLLMATVGPDGEPAASYAPYVVDAADCFYIYVSELAAHTANLRRHPRVSVLFIEDEREAPQVFARKRMTYACQVEAIGRETPAFAEILDWFEDRHGPLMKMLRELRDFHLFRLVPERATYVRGFAQAFQLSGDDLRHIRPRNDQGHRTGTT
jgi:heme iron utilization protein